MSKKILTITLHNTDNCGSSLQAYALQRALINLNYDSKLIDYNPRYIKYNGSRARYWIRCLIHSVSSYKRNKKFKNFKHKYLLTTEYSYKNINELSNANFDVDCYITGSDQLWNTMYKCGNDPAYYLAFCNKKKIAYAVSLGRKNIPKDNIEMINKYINSFDWVSFREKSSYDQICHMAKNASYVCDPVFLNEVYEYRSIQSSSKYNFKYILVYVAQAVDKEQLDKLIKKLGNDCKIIFVGSYRKRCNCDIHIRDMGPLEFLSLIDNAEYVVSNSFHATAFSIIYQKQFVTILPDENGERIEDLMELIGIKGHTVSNSELSQYTYSTIDEETYDEISIRIKNIAEKSKKLLIEYIGEK